MIGQRSGLVVLARLRLEYASPGGPPEVHAYLVPAEKLGEPVVLTAPCGHVLEPGKGEQVAVFVGVPCVPCMLYTLGNDAADERPALATEPERPVGDIADSRRYAVGLRGDHMRHLVADNAIRSTLDGRDVVHTACGHLGRGPLESAPEHWPICPECCEAAGVVA
ncbi:hypothetical protein [Saccharopolyspora sp. ASAGF58]|uniref:hypothetical protein n=1 Tax=Saccharopolyspora sp. ASAGF58 TaxID=2719023 RepID=UPI0014401C67|nr:hypothetical protein [Saccharopolyspora sp. ASAGF58]QIZ36982.1 hypothetical protein FDZ84_22965 [Saccharopolyspora sp. ASAGF58]